jgi:HTH-type transcriptional regulator / antitoxin HigA
MDIQPIKNVQDLEKALARIDEIIDAREGTAEFNEREALSSLIAEYEDEHKDIAN